MSEENLVFDKASDFEVESALSDNVREIETEKYLIFSSSGILYGVNADYVAEIITETSVTHLPMVPPYISGVINIRGQIVTIIDFRMLLGQMPGENYSTIVLDVEGTQIGILVDTVEQMVDIEKSSILPVPSQQQAQSLGTDRMCTLPNGNGTMMVLDCSRLLHE